MIISSPAAHDKNEAQTTGNTAGLKCSLYTEGYSTFLEEVVGKNKISINRFSLAICTVWQPVLSGNLYCM